MRIAIITSNPAGIYSGGRYLSLIMAYSLARAGESVIYATDNLPMFDADFVEYDLNFPIQKVVDKAFAFPDLGQLDWIIVIPTGGVSDAVYSAAARTAGASGARISLMSFESPNWFNAHAHHKRSGLPWEAWRKAVAQGGLVLTIAREGIEPARKFYKSPNHRAAVEYAFWHPPINDLVADKVATARGSRDKIVAFVRTQDPHKGAADLLRLDPHVFKGKLLSPVFGRSVEASYLDALKRHYSHAGVAIEPHDRISDREKFELLAEAQLLLFPSYFEGFGYPVVEAAYMGVPSVAYDLPVVRETVGEAALYVAPGDHAAFSRAVEQALAMEPGPAVRAKLRIDPDTLTAGLKLQRLLKAHLKLVVPLKNATSPVQVESAARAEVLADPVVQAHWRTALASHRFREVAGVVSAGGLTVTGKVETTGADATLRVTFRGQRLPASAVIKSSKSEIKKFSLEQTIGPIESIETVCRIDVFEQGKVTATQTVPLRFAPDALFRADAWAGGPARQAFGLGGERVLLLSELDRLIAGGLETLAMSELAARFSARGLPVTLILETDWPSEAIADCDLDADLLPLVDAVEHAPKGTGAALLDALGGVGGLTLAAPADLCSGLADRADILLQLGDGLAPVVIARSSPHPGSKPIEIDYAPTLLSSRAETRSTRRRVVIAGAAPKAGIEDGWRRLFEVILPRAAAEIAAAQVVIHRDLLARAPDKDLIRRFADATGWMVSAGDFSKLVSHARDAARVVAIDVGDTTRDGRLAALNGSLGTALARLSTTGDDDCLDAVTETLGAGTTALETTSALGAAFAAAWPPPSATDLIQRHSLARASLAAEMGDDEGLVRVPTLGVGQTLALPAQSDPEADYLVQGWSPRHVDGSAMAASGALIAFNLEELPTGAVTLELLIRSKAPKNTMLKCAVALNGQEVGTISLDRPIAKLFAFPLPTRLWRANGVQLLTFRPEPAVVENVEHTPLLIGLALMTYPAVMDWTIFDKDQPIVELTRLDEAVTYPIRFRFRGEGSDHAMLGRGWGSQEPWHVWSVDPIATVMAAGEPTDGRPALVTIEAGALITDMHKSQRVSLEANGAALGERRTTQGFPTRMAFAAAPSDLELGLEGVVLRFADCVRPKDLGLSADARQLGVSLTEFAIELPAGDPSSCELGPAVGAAREIAASLAAFDHAAAIMRLTGIGEHGGIMIVGGGATEARVTTRISDGRWEAWIGLADLSVDRSVTVRFEPDDETEAADAVGLDGVEVWPVGPDLGRPYRLSVDYKLSISLESLLARPSVELSFGSDADSAILVDGWSAPEQTFRWSRATNATIDLSRFGATADFTLLRFDLSPFVYDELLSRQTIEFGGGGIEFARAVLAKPGRAQIVIALDSAAGCPEMLVLRFPEAATPQELGLSSDTRQLGVQLFAMAFDSVPADRVARVPLAALKDGWAVSRSATTPTALLVEFEGPSDGAPTHLGLQGSGVYAAVARTGDRASAILALPGDILDGSEPALIVEAGEDGGGNGFVEENAFAEILTRVREDA